jgi:hypothetical protein
MDIATLRTELTTDPRGYGYIGATDLHCAELLNQMRANGDPLQEKIDRESPIEASEILGATVSTDWDSLVAAAKEKFRILLDVAPLDYRVVNVRNWAASIFGAATATRANLLALQQRPCTRAEKLGGPGDVVSIDQVKAARA